MLRGDDRPTGDSRDSATTGEWSESTAMPSREAAPQELSDGYGEASPENLTQILASIAPTRSRIMPTSGEAHERFVGHNSAAPRSPVAEALTAGVGVALDAQATLVPDGEAPDAGGRFATRIVAPGPGAPESGDSSNSSGYFPAVAVRPQALAQPSLTTPAVEALDDSGGSDEPAWARQSPDALDLAAVDLTGASVFRWSSVVALLVALVGGALEFALVSSSSLHQEIARRQMAAASANLAVIGSSGAVVTSAAPNPSIGAVGERAPSDARAPQAEEQAPSLESDRAHPAQPVPRAKRVKRITLRARVFAARMAAKKKQPARGAALASIGSAGSPSRMASARLAFDQGTTQFNQGSIESAAASYREALRLFPGFTAAYRGLGLAEARLGKTREALDAFATYCRLLPNAPDVVLIKRRIVALEHRSHAS